MATGCLSLLSMGSVSLIMLALAACAALLKKDNE